MISKEKLLNGYIKTDNRELVRLFLSECLKYDDINLPYISSHVFSDWEYFALTDRGTPCRHGIGDISEKEELTLDDFKPKPKTKVTYELVTDMTNGEIAKAMIDGKVFYDKYGIDYYQWSGSRFINNKGFSASCDGDFYQKVEKETGWKDEVCRILNCDIASLNDWLNLFPDNEKGFIKLCHLVAELTDKPE